MRPGDVFRPIVRVLNPFTGAAVTGLVTADFTVAGTKDAATQSLSATATEISLGRYSINVTLPATPGQIGVFISSGAHTVQGGNWQGEIEAQDLDSIYAVVVRPQAQQTGITAQANDVTLTLRAYRFASLTVSVVDSAGAAVDLSGYNAARFTVWNLTHSGGSHLYQLASGISMSALGVVTWDIPEDAAFFSQITAALTAGQNQVTLYYDMIADAAATATKTTHIFGGQLILRRFEGAAS